MLLVGAEEERMYMYAQHEGHLQVGVLAVTTQHQLVWHMDTVFERNSDDGPP